MSAAVATPSTPIKMSIASLATLVTRQRSQQNGDHANATIELFGDLLPGVVDLATTFAAMEQAGYQLGQPQRVARSTKPGWTEWRVDIRHDTVQFAIAFFIEQDVS